MLNALPGTATRAMDLTQLAPGFGNPGMDAQLTFRQCLDALARPGTLLTVDQTCGAPAPLTPAAGALALALLDQDTTLWLSPGLRLTGAYVRFHTGCQLTSDPDCADFAIVNTPDELPPLPAFCQGSDEFPEQSTTIIVQTGKLDTAIGWTLSGPGIPDTASLHADGCAAAFAAHFAAQWQANHAQFPRGVDMLFVSGRHLCGLPRSTRIES